LLAAAITEETGYRLLAFDVTLEQRIPSVWLMAVDDAGDPLRPRVSCAAGAHLDPDCALAGALHELAPGADLTHPPLPAARRARPRPWPATVS
jgi:ribosomal protein S12 methylthiotransferase accessory factor